ncbi:hypothetical protein SEEAA707_19102 [Salmonella enterica subsp. enterica serovar Agona str. ATCC BAA-707]|nr:hypothetical protein SEEAA707_19102 [Salmonella enterica subsp. enterica serovar Agona str. ATCC BAA-707]ESH95130.1 hypothetical protein SEEA1957_11925 [Salmonella enterica subsp. enterica serovar Agona str. ATCC 51957]
MILFSSAVLAGLSPLARGTLAPEIFMIIGIRFIPAGAGNTSYSRKCLGDDPVYPRWRGEHVVSPVDLAVKIGLSPLARGTL